MKKMPANASAQKTSIFGSVSAPVSAEGKARPRAPARGPRRGLARRMSLYFLLFSLLPLAVVGTLNYLNARQAILEDRLEFLEAIATRQINEILYELEDINDIVLLIAESQGVRDALAMLDGMSAADLPTRAGSALETEVDRRFGRGFRQLRARLGLSEFYLINRDQLVGFSQPGIEASFRDLKDAANRDGELAAIVRRTLRLVSTQTSDLRVNPATAEPALFLSAPVLADGLLLGVVVVSVDAATLEEMLNDYTGLGLTGEVIFGSVEGDQIRILNNLRHALDDGFNGFFPRYPGEDGVPTPLQRAVDGENGAGVTRDNDGREVVAIWRYLPNLRMGLVIQMDRAEVFAPVINLAYLSFWIALITALLAAVAAVALSRGITRPIAALTVAANRLAEGDLSGEVSIQGRHEIGQLAKAARTMSFNLKSLVGKVKATAGEISRTAASIAESSGQQVATAEQTGTSVTEVNATARQISTTAHELAGTMAEVGELTQETADRAESGFTALQSIEKTMQALADGNEDVSRQLTLIDEKAQVITGVIATMTKMADQANLLSLNAAIEARKAGDYGKGFSVVAAEIRELADQAAVSTLEIEQSIGEMAKAVRSGVTGVAHFSRQVNHGVTEVTATSGRLSEVIQRVQGLPPRFDQVREGMESQAEGASQINEAMIHLNDSAQQTVTAVKTINRMLDNLRRSAEMLQAEVSRFKT